MRTEQWHYVEYETGELELYDVIADPYQLENLAGTVDPAILAPLADRLALLKACAGEECRAAEAAPLDEPSRTAAEEG